MPKNKKQTKHQTKRKITKKPPEDKQTPNHSHPPQQQKKPQRKSHKQKPQTSSCPYHFSITQENSVSTWGIVKDKIFHTPHFYCKSFLNLGCFLGYLTVYLQLLLKVNVTQSCLFFPQSFYLIWCSFTTYFF